MSRSDASVSGPAVLVVDDDQALRGLFTALLSRKGFNVDYAGDGSAAWERLSQNPYSVILLDLMMPGVNGFELLEKVRRDSPSLLSRIIIMTGASQRMLESLDTTRVWGLIRKPFDIDNLVSSTVACSQGQRRGNA